MSDLDETIQRAEEAAFVGWDFSHLEGRLVEEPPPWDFAGLVQDLLGQVESALDMGTGGGEFLATFAGHLPDVTHATEGYAPNIEAARQRLEPLGVKVLGIGKEFTYRIPLQDEVYCLPLADRSVGLVMNRHESFDASEVARVLTPGGVFITQQVGPDNHADLRRLFGAENPFAAFTLEAACAQVDAAGLRLRRAEESRTKGTFSDIGALVYYLRAIPWEVPGFSPTGHRDVLNRLHRGFATGQKLEVTCHRFLIAAERAG